MTDSMTAQRQAERFFEDKQYDKALEAYRALHKETGAAKYIYNTAICHYHLAHYTEAAALLENIWADRALAPDSGMFLGFCYRAMNQFMRGRNHFLTMADETRGETRARCRLMAAILTDENGDSAKAEETYRQLKDDPDVSGLTRADVFRRLATIQENKKDHMQALSLYRESLAHDPDGEGALSAKFRMAVCLIEMATPAESVELLKEVEASTAGTFLGQSAAKLRQAVESSVRRAERNIKSYE